MVINIESPRAAERFGPARRRITVGSRCVSLDSIALVPGQTEFATLESRLPDLEWLGMTVGSSRVQRNLRSGTIKECPTDHPGCPCSLANGLKKQWDRMHESFRLVGCMAV